MDLYNNTKFFSVIAPQLVTTSAAATVTLDASVGGVMFVLQVGSALTALAASKTLTLKLEESADGSTFNDVAADNVIGATPVSGVLLTVGSGGEQCAYGAEYRGGAAKVRATVIASGVTSGAQVALVAVCGGKQFSADHEPLTVA